MAYESDIVYGFDDNKLKKQGVSNSDFQNFINEDYKKQVDKHDKDIQDLSTDISELTISQKNTSAVHACAGLFINGQDSKNAGSGTAIVTLHRSGLVVVEYDAVITSGGLDTDVWKPFGINAGLLNSLNSNIPVITPKPTPKNTDISGSLNIVTPEGVIRRSSLSYCGVDCLTSVANQYWRFSYLSSRVGGAYTPAVTSVYNSNSLAQNTRVFGVAYGTFDADEYFKKEASK